MPIRFRCRQCNVLLSISSRKSGSEIKCPKCSVPQVVPTTDAALSFESTAVAPEPVTTAAATPAPAAAETATAETPSVKPPVVAKEAPAISDTPAAEEATSDGPLTVTVYEEILEPVEETPPAASAAPASTPDVTPAAPAIAPTLVVSATAAAAAPAEPEAKARPAPKAEIEPSAADVALAPPPPAPAVSAPGGMILYRRRTLYIHGMLFALLALTAFGAGYWIGRGNATVQLQVEHEEARRSRVLVEGLLTWLPEPKQPTGDENAVVIALPEGKAPPKLIPFTGLRPVDPPPGEFHKGVKAIKDLGGDYTRADALGKFSLVVPDQGRYRVLIISRHAARKGDPFAQDADMAEIGAYLQSPESLIGRYKYRWTSEEIKPGFNPIEISFGEDGK